MTSCDVICCYVICFTELAGTLDRRRAIVVCASEGAADVFLILCSSFVFSKDKTTSCSFHKHSTHSKDYRQQQWYFSVKWVHPPSFDPIWRESCFTIFLDKNLTSWLYSQSFKNNAFTFVVQTSQQTIHLARVTLQISR